MRPAGPREYKNYAECKDVSLYSAGVESFRAERGSGSDKRIVSGSLYDDVQHLGFRGVRGDRFLTYPNRAGSLETCGFKQTFWSLLGLRPKVTRARGAEYSPCWGHGGNMSGPSGTPAPTGCVYLGAPVFGKPPIWTQQSRCTITDRRISARCVGAAAIRGS